MENRYLEKIALRAHVRELMSKTFMPKTLSRAEVDMTKSIRKSQSNTAINKARSAPSTLDSNVSTRKPGFYSRAHEMRQRATAARAVVTQS